MAETPTKNGPGLSLSKGLWTTNTLAPAPIIILSSLKQGDLCLKSNSKMEETFKILLHLKKAMNNQKNQQNRQKNKSITKFK